MSAETPPPPLPEGTRRGDGRYTLHALLGRGGMGEVYRARDERLRRRVAIKRLRAAAIDGAPPDPGDAQRRARLQQEAQLLAQLGHPAIVQVFDLFEDTDGDWIVMELVEGRTLAALRDEGALAVGDVLRHGAELCAALVAAHGRGIIHRDLKAENVMISTGGQLKILDFGLAKRLPRSRPESAAAAESTAPPGLSVEGQVVGTVRAMAPEQARGLAVDARSDLFSLGVLLYELIARRSPFAGASTVDTLLRVATLRQPPLVELPGLAPRVPRALSELVDQLLEKAAELRPASAAEVRARLLAIAAAEEAATEPAGEGEGEDDGERAADRVSVIAAQETELSLDASPPDSRLGGEGLGAATATVQVPSAASAEGAAPPADRAPSAEQAPAARGRRAGLALAGLGAAGAVIAVAASLLGGDAAPGPAASGSQASATAPGAPAPVRRDPRAAYERGMALLRDFYRPGAIDTAAGIFQQLLRDDERSAAAYAGLARAHWHRYVFTDATRDAMFLQQAQAAAERALALDELLVDARVSHGLVALERGQLDRAAQDLEAALALDARNPDVHDALARLHQARQQLDAAEAAYRRAIALAPSTSYLLDDLGALLVQRGRYDDAIRLFERSIALAPDSPYGYSNLGSAYLLQGRYADAAQRLQDALKIRASSSTYSNLGTVLFAQGLYGPAASAFERSLAMGGAAHDHRRWGNLADAYRQLPGSADQAREHYDHAIGLLDAELARAPQDLTLRSRRALYLAKRGDCRRADAALATLEGAREPTAYTVFRVAVALELCGHRARAIAMVARALAAGFSQAELDNDPELRALRADPAYARVLRRRGAPEPPAPAGPAAASPAIPR